jgi:hypothetical protein
MDNTATLLTVYSPGAMFDLNYFRQKYTKLLFSAINNNSFQILLQPKLSEFAIDFELDVKALLSSNCKMNFSVVFPLHLKRKTDKFLGSTLKSINTVLTSIESISFLLYFKVNISFIIIDFINKNKLFMYIFGLKPYLPRFLKDFNLFITSDNYKSNNVAVINFFNLNTPQKINSFDNSKFIVGHRINEFFFEEVEILEMFEILMVVLLILLRLMFKVAQWCKNISLIYSESNLKM